MQQLQMLLHSALYPEAAAPTASMSLSQSHQEAWPSSTAGSKEISHKGAVPGDVSSRVLLTATSAGRTAGRWRRSHQPLTAKSAIDYWSKSFPPRIQITTQKVQLR